MKNIKKLFEYVAVALVLVAPAMSLAAEFRAGETPSVGKEELVAGDLYIGGGSVTSSGTVAGDLFVGGGNIVINGDVGADLFSAGGNVNILSNVADDVRAAGGTLVIQGKVGGDVLASGGQITIGGAGVEGDVIIGAGNVRIDAPVAGKLQIAGGNVFINSAIAGDVNIEAEKVTLGSSAVIYGNLTYKSKNELVKEEGAVVAGKIDFTQREYEDISRNTFLAIFSAFLLWKFLALLVAALLVGLLLKRFSREIINFTVARPFHQLGKGLIVLIVLPIVSMLLFATLIGIPIGVIGLLALPVAFLFAWIVAPIILGSVVYRFLSKRELEISWKTILLGVFLFSLLGIIPVVGCTLQMLLTLIALGSVVTLKFQILREWR